MSNISAIEQAFRDADVGGDGLLTQDEFLNFVQIGLNKTCGPEMYFQLCAHTQCNPETGLRWTDIKQVFEISNQQPSGSNTGSRRGSRGNINDPSPGHSRSSSRRRVTQTNVNPEIVSNGIDNFSDVASDVSHTEPLSTPGGHHRRVSSTSAGYLPGVDGTPRLRRTSSSTNNVSNAEAQFTDILQRKNLTMEKKIRELRKKLNAARKAQKNLEKDKTGLLEQQQTLTEQLRELQKALQRQERSAQEDRERLGAANKQMEDKIQLLQSQLDDDRKTINHLGGQVDLVTTERDQVLALFKNAEKKFEDKIHKLKKKHKEEINKLSEGYLKSLAPDQNNDARMMVNDLKEQMNYYKKQINLLAEQLTRKDRSLFEALQAIDVLTSTTMSAAAAVGSAFGDGRRPSLRARLSGHRRTPSGNTPGNDYNPVLSSPTLRTTVASVHKPSASFFIDAMTPQQTEELLRSEADNRNQARNQQNRNNARANGESIDPIKNMERVSNGLTADLIARQEEVESLQIANRELGQQLREFYNQNNTDNPTQSTLP